jgi:ElaB/YqjD/DUF883 family membrane-anchored ribosome-binding protein
VTELVDTVIDAAGRMMATVLELADAPRIRALEAEVHAAIKSRDEQIERLKADRDMFVKHHERVLADQAASAQRHIDELRDEIKTRAHVEQQRLEEIAVLRRELDETLVQLEARGEIAAAYGAQRDALKRQVANLELAVAEARGDVEA